MKNYSLLFLSALVSFSAAAESLSGAYELSSSRVEYTVQYLVKKADGASTASKGKGLCSEKECEFLVAAPVKSFESKDSNRDYNMLKTTKADKHPMVVARLKTPAVISSEFKADVEIDFAGVKYTYPQVVFKTSGNAQSFSAEGSVNVSLTNHKIEKPSLLGVEVEDRLPVSINAQWNQRKN